MTDQDGDAAPPAWTPSLKIIHSELDARRASNESRSNAIDTKATLLITGSGVLAVVLAAEPTGWTKAAIMANLVSVLIGVVCIWPRRGREIGIGQTRDKYLDRPVSEAELAVVDTTIATYEADEDRLLGRARILGVGFCVFALSVALVMVSTLV